MRASEWTRLQEVILGADSDIKQLGSREVVLKHFPDFTEKLGMSYVWKVDDTNSDVSLCTERLVAGFCSRGA